MASTTLVIAWAVLIIALTSLGIAFASLILLYRLTETIRKEIEQARQAPELRSLAEQVAGLRRVVDRLNDTICEELLDQQESLGTITHDD